MRVVGHRGDFTRVVVPIFNNAGDKGFGEILGCTSEGPDLEIMIDALKYVSRRQKHR